MKYNKKEICIRANQLTGQGMNKSAAFKTAWAEAKTPVEPNDIVSKAMVFKEIQASEMKYIITNKCEANGMYADDNNELTIGNIFTERYTREEAHPIAGYITEFLNWLELHGYMDRYKEKWAVIEN